MAFGGAFAAFAAAFAAFAAVTVQLLQPVEAFGVCATILGFAAFGGMWTKAAAFMHYMESNAALWSEKLAYMEHRLDQSAGNIGDRCRHVMNVVMDYDCSLAASKGGRKMDFWVVRRLQVEFEATCRMCSSAVFKEQLTTWRMVQTEVLWRLQRDICACRWVEACSQDAADKKAAAEELKRHLKGLQNCQLFVAMKWDWDPMQPEEVRAHEALCWEQAALQRQILERFQEVQWYLQAHGEYADGLIDVEGLGGVWQGCSDKKVGVLKLQLQTYIPSNLQTFKPSNLH